jgi:threonyl-tRNA synthetase
MKTKEELEKIRHSLAHLLAAAVQELYPAAKPTLGPAIDNGFYYDFDFGELKITESDLAKIEKKMRAILPTWDQFERQEATPAEAGEHFSGNEYKQELITELASKSEPITLYRSGNFTDLCRGGHVESAKDIPSDGFKLDRVAGAYWRGDEKNKMLTRIYGLAFGSSAELAAHLKQVEEAEKRDHRKLGRELDLFTFSDLVGSGLPLFTPRGTLVRDLIVAKIEECQAEFGYQRVTIPHITKKDLYVTSGHWEKFKDELFKVHGVSDTEFVMKPMNCPHHTQIYAAKPRSYKELPLRFAETTMVYRDEQAGELLGLARVRSITQDDAHVFCRLDQVGEEVRKITAIIRRFYTALDMFKAGDYWVSLSVRDSKNLTKYLGTPANWDLAEKVLEEVAQAEKLDYRRVEGEAAFYGPKLDFMFRDSLGRERQLATAQVDFVMPERFELTYTDREGKSQTPVMIHRAIAGSLERFMAVMLEHFAGALPAWLSPVQVKILPIGEAHLPYARETETALRQKNVRVELDDSNETLGKKIRQAKMEKVPFVVVIGDQEVASRKLTIEQRDGGKLENQTVEDLIKLI